MMKSTSSRLELNHYSSKKQHLWASKFGITWENRSANHITNEATVSAFNDYIKVTQEARMSEIRFCDHRERVWGRWPV